MVDPTVWLIDSGSGHHVTWNPTLFQELISAPFGPTFVAANGSQLEATHIGNIGSPSDKLFVRDAFLVPGLKCNLISVGQLCEQGARVIFSSSGCIIEDSSTGRVLGRGHKHGTHFFLDELNMYLPEGLERQLQMPPAMSSEANRSSNWAQVNEALGISSEQSLTGSSGTNNQRGSKRRITDIENIAIQPLEVPNLETTFRWIESELMEDQVEVSNEESFLIDLEIYQYDLWILAYN